MDRKDDQPWWRRALTLMSSAGRFTNTMKEYVEPPLWWEDELMRIGMATRENAPRMTRMMDEFVSKGPRPAGGWGVTAQATRRALPLVTAALEVSELGGSTPGDRMRQQWYNKFKQREGVAGAPAKFNPGPFRPPWK